MQQALKYSRYKINYFLKKGRKMEDLENESCALTELGLRGISALAWYLGPKSALQQLLDIYEHEMQTRLEFYIKSNLRMFVEHPMVTMCNNNGIKISRVRINGIDADEFKASLRYGHKVLYKYIWRIPVVDKNQLKALFNEVRDHSTWGGAVTWRD